MINRSIGILSRFHPAKLLLLCYLVYAFVGWFILLTPICQMNAIPSVDCFFTAIAAMTTTGLNTVDVGTAFSFLGQIVILLLIQAGGIGYMTFNSFIILATTNRLSRFTKKITTAEFPMPKDFIISEFIAHVVIFTFVCEAIGAIALSWIFKNSGVDNYIWNGIFHSISAFCTAGFSLFPDSLAGFKSNAGVNIVISTLSIIGAIGFITWLNFYKKVIGEKKFLSFTAKVILLVTFWFLVIGTLVFFFTEHSFRGGFTAQNLWTSFFQVMTASTTAGFNTIDLGSLKYTSIVLLLALMVIGASPSGTGGGLKTTTFVALVGLVKSTLKGESVVNFWKREIPLKRLQLATATFTYYVFVLTIAVFFLLSMEDKPFLPILFEAASALATIGLSMGITSSLAEGSKIIIAILMLMGKMGILTFGIAITVQGKKAISFKKDNELIF